MATPRTLKRRRSVVRRRRRKIYVLIFALLFILAFFVVMRATLALAYESVDLSTLVKAEFTGFNEDGTVILSVNDQAVDELLSRVKEDHDSAWFHTTEVEDSDYAKFRQSLSFSTPKSSGLSNGESINIIASCNEPLAKKLKIDITSKSGTTTVDGLLNVTKIPLDEVFADLDVSFTGISPALEMTITNNSTQPLISRMTFEAVDPKEYYADGDTVTIQAIYTDQMCEETGYTVDRPVEACVRDYSVTCDQTFVSSASDLPRKIIQEAVTAGKKAFSDANEYGVRIFCEANLVPVYIDQKATFTYGTPNFVSAYFKTVFPEKSGELGLAHNDLDIIYDVKISQADGQSCTAYAAVRFSDIVKNGDGSYSYDFSSPSILSESYFSARVKKNVVDSYANSYDIERVNP